MKKIIMTLAIAISSLASFAGEENVNSTVLTSFSNEFTNAKDVTWTTGRNSYKASFLLNDHHVIAYYSLEGELMGLTRNISSLDLPMSLQSSLKKQYDGYWISDLFEVSNGEGTNYYITLEKADEQVILQSTSATKWSVYKKATKA